MLRKLLAIGIVVLVSTALAVAQDEGPELTIGLASEPTAVDPHFHNLISNNSLAKHLFDPLILTDERQRHRPGLAVSWQPIDDTTWELKLREGVTFHDGTPFTADDVVFTFERAPEVPNSPSSFATYIKGKTAVKVDDYTVHIKTDAPYPLMPNDLTTFTIVSKKHGEGASTADYNSGAATVGTGPYRFVEYVPGDRIVLERNDTYWGPQSSWARVVFRPIPSGPARVAALLAGDVDFIEGVPTVDIKRLEGDDTVQLSQGTSNRVIYLHLDQFREDSPFIAAKDGGEIKNPLLDQRVRLALSKAIYRDAIVARVMEGVAIPAGQLLPEGFFGVSPNLEPVAYDPEGAKALLAEAGFEDGFRLTLHGPNDRYINDARIIEAIAQMLTRIGIDTQVETMTRSVFFSRASRGGPDGTPEFSVVLVGWGAGSGEASSPLKSLIHTYDPEGGFGASNRGRYANPEVDAVIQEALATVDDAQRQDLLAKATEMAIEDVAIIPLHYQVNTWAGRRGLQYQARSDEHTHAMTITPGE